MKKTGRLFVIVFIVSYIVLSLPAMLGFGYVIDWVGEATLLQKFKAYVVDGLVQNMLLKAIVSLVLAFVVTFIVKSRIDKNS